MWMAHFKHLYNSVNDQVTRDLFYERIESLSSLVDYTFSVKDIVEACAVQKQGKSIGNDGIAMEAYIHGGSRLHIHIALLFNLFARYSYVPSHFMKCIFVPLVKCKTGDLSDVNNYRAISVSTAISKLFEFVLAKYVESADAVDAYQFGFTAGHSTSLCTHVLKRTVDYYTDRGSHVFTCFLDFSKAFDKVNYWKLFHKLLDDKCDSRIVKLLAYWYSHQEACVRWHNSISQFFTIGNGTRQGGVLSPRLFTRYIRDLLAEIVNSGIGCDLGSKMLNILAYADDIVIMSPSWRGLQCLLDIVSAHICNIDMVANPNKSVCMVYVPKQRSKVVCDSFPLLRLGGAHLQYVNNFKYLGHQLVNDGNDDSDIKREIANLFIRTNILRRRFFNCSPAMKVILFKSYCICLYGTALWRRFNEGTVKKLRSCYYKCIKMFFAFRRRDSISCILSQLALPSLDTVLSNSVFFAKTANEYVQ
jgi:hypothetical protein